MSRLVGGRIRGDRPLPGLYAVFCTHQDNTRAGRAYLCKMSCEQSNFFSNTKVKHGQFNISLHIGRLTLKSWLLDELVLKVAMSVSLSVCVSVCLCVCPLPMQFISRPFIGNTRSHDQFPGLLLVPTV